MAGALKGIRIIDLTSMISGPSATMILGDQDAEIIKIENTSVGDYTRIVSTQSLEFQPLTLTTIEIRNLCVLI